MEGKKLIERFMPSIGEVLFVSLFLWMLTMGVELLNDGDTGWHIITGDTIIRTMSIPDSDPYSYSLPGIPWTAHEWLAEVMMSAAHSLGGLNLLVVMSSLVISLTFYLLYRYLVFMGIRPLTAAILTVLAASASTIHWLARPHILSFPLTLAYIAALDSFQRGRADRLYWLPPLMVFWANVHGGYILGIMLVCLYIGGNAFMYIFDSGNTEIYGRKARRLSLILGLALLGACINPHGPAILYFPFHLVGREFIMDNVMEWLSPNFHDNTSFEILMLFFIVMFVTSRRRPDVFEGGAALMMLHMSLYSARYIPLMALIVTPAIAPRFEEVVSRLAGWAGARRSVVRRISDRMARTVDNTTRMEDKFGGIFWVVAAGTVCVLIAYNGGRIGDRAYMDYRHKPDRFPVAAVEFAIDNGIQGNMFNNDSWGGYIIYRTKGHYKVFFDGRSDMYGVEFMKEYMEVIRARLGCRDVLDKYGVDWVIYNANAPVCQLLAGSGDWKLVFADTTANILLRDTPENRPLIDKYSGARFVPKDEDEE